ncbi:MAG: hypothetical protein ACOYMA_19665 [Bacteroidia bacterium]
MLKINLYSQNCNCMLQFQFADTSFVKYIPNKTTRLEYINDSLFILKKGRSKEFEIFSFENFSKFYQIRDDSFYINNGTVYQKFGNKINIVFSPEYFKKKKRTIKYEIIFNNFFYEPANNNYEIHLYEYFPLEKIKIEKQNWFKDYPISKIEINDDYFYKYLVKEFIYYAKFDKTDSNELFNKINKIKKRKFISVKKFDSEKEKDYYLYTIPGRFFIYDSDNKIDFIIYNYLKTEGCDNLIRKAYKNWELP